MKMGPERRGGGRFGVGLLALSLLVCACAGPLGGGGGSDGGSAKAAGHCSWMCFNLPWKDGVSLPDLGRWHTKESEEPAIRLDPVRDYTVYCALGTNQAGVYAVLRVGSDGSATAAYQDNLSRRYYEKSFRLTAQQVQALTRCLQENRAGDLAESYVDLNVQDGTQGGFTLLAGGLTRRTYLSNAWPSEIKNIFEFLCDDILRFEPQRKENGFWPVGQSLLQRDPEATLAVRGLVHGQRKSMKPPVKSSRN